MRYLSTFLLNIFVLCNCTLSKNSEIDWSQEDVKETLLFDSISMKYIPPAGKEFYRVEKKHCCPLKGETLGIFSQDSLRYTVVKEKRISDGYIYRLLCTSFIGENDTPIKLSVLHTYKDDKLLDCIALSLDFIFEIKHFANFIVSEKQISIDRYEIDYLLYNEDNGSIIGERNTPDTTIYRSVYNIVNGYIENKQVDIYEDDNKTTIYRR